MRERQANVDSVSDRPDETRVRDELAKRLVAIDEEIFRVYEEGKGEPKELYETGLHLLQAGGKRIRSLLTALSCEAVGGTFEEVLPFSVAAEFVQTASLIHDDVIDNDDIRRGVESTHKKFGNKLAIIAGDLLVAKAVQLVNSYASPELIEIVASAGIKMCEGEASDILMYFTTPTLMTKESYFDVVRRKTVSFMRAATRVGGMVGKATDEQLEILDSFGENFGYAFQIRDDILDVVSSVDSIGKSSLSDLKGTKANYVLIHALSLSTELESKKCLELLKKGDIDNALQLIERTNAVAHAKTIAQEYAEMAKAAIRGRGFNSEDLLYALADLAGTRDF